VPVPGCVSFVDALSAEKSAVAIEELVLACQSITVT
jgi:hypothetical protein